MTQYPSPSAPADVGVDAVAAANAAAVIAGGVLFLQHSQHTAPQQNATVAKHPQQKTIAGMSALMKTTNCELVQFLGSLTARGHDEEVPYWTDLQNELDELVGESAGAYSHLRFEG